MTRFDLRRQDCIKGLSRLADESVDLVVTSPPHNLRIGLRKILLYPGSRFVFELGRRMGGTDSARPETERLIFPKHRRGAIQPNVAARDRHGAARSIRAAKYNSLDQIDRHRHRCCENRTVRPSSQSSPWPGKGGREVPGEGRTHDKKLRSLQTDQFEAIS